MRGTHVCANCCPNPRTKARQAAVCSTQPLAATNKMKKIQFIILLTFIVSTSLSSQSLATNILFEQANVVYKGKVEKIRYVGSDAEGDDFGISTIVKKVYKNGFSGEEIGIRVKKIYVIDTISGQILMNYQFQIKEDSTYVFFIQKTEEFRENGKYIYFANLADDQIEGIPFSVELEKELETYDQLSYIETNNYGRIPFKILFQSSPVSLGVKVQKIESKKKWKLISGISESGENILIKTKGLNCICENGHIEENKIYLFFLTPFEEDRYLLTDRWLGIFQLDSITKEVLDYYKRAAANKG